MSIDFKQSFQRTAIYAYVAISVLICSLEATAQKSKIDRYEFDFIYQGIEYLILSETDRTVAVAQPYDIDFAAPIDSPMKAPNFLSDIGPNGFIMSRGLFGDAVVIPPTVYDDEGTPYTVTDLADGAINWVYMGMLALPNTLERLNNGIVDVSLSDLYLPDGLKEISGIHHCANLKNLYIPSRVESIGNYAFSFCGLEKLYLPPSVKKIGNNALEYCDSLTTVVLSEIESMGTDCCRNCTSLIWANLPETLRALGEGCFNGCSGLELVSLPWSEIKMDGCFNECPAISRIEVLATEPYPFPAGSFLDVDRRKCILRVPIGSEDRYRKAEGWKEFGSIVGELPAVDPSGAAAIPDVDFRAFGGKGTLAVINPSAKTIEVVGINGEKAAVITKNGRTELQLPAGVYVVSSPFGSRKVAVN